MEARPIRRRQATRIAAAAALALAAACSGDDGGGLDAGPDGPSVDAGPLTFETQATDIATALALFEVSVTEEGTDNTASSAPNGRAVLELDGDARILHELGGYLSNRMSVSGEALAAHSAARQPQLSELATAADLDDIYAGLGLVRDDATTQVLIYARSSSDFSPATGVAITGASAVRRASGDFETGDAVVDDALVIVANAPGTTLSISPPASCVGATDIALLPGAIASTFLLCD